MRLKKHITRRKRTRTLRKKRKYIQRSTKSRSYGVGMSSEYQVSTPSVEGGSNLAIPIQDTAQYQTRNQKGGNPKRIAVITAIYGGYDNLKEPTEVNNKELADWFCFTEDTNMKSPIWKIINTPYHIQNGKEEYKQYTNWFDNIKEDKTKNMMSAKYYKIKTHEIDILKGYDYYIWVDGSLLLRPGFLNNIIKLIDRYELINFKHPARTNIKDEMALSITMTKYMNQNIPAQYDAYIKDGFPDDLGLFECTMIIKKNIPRINEVFDLWWIQNMQYSYQDQISYTYCLWKKGVKPDYVIEESVFDNPNYSYSDRSQMSSH